MPENWVFLGNPGVGKSTLLNCLMGRAAFPSGVSYGGGMTKAVQTCVDDRRNIVYTDTPGLADRTIERQAADAITRALRSSGPRTKLCFVVRLQYGRMMSQDLATIERVLDSIHVADVKFGIIINCVGAAVARKLRNDLHEFKRLAALINSGKYKTPHLLVIPEIKELIDEDDCVVNLPECVRFAIEQFPIMSIPAHVVATIEVAGYPSALDRLSRQASKLERDDDAMIEAQAELTRLRSDFWQVASNGVLVLGKVMLAALAFI